jgi:hypothetical protein
MRNIREICTFLVALQIAHSAAGEPAECSTAVELNLCEAPCSLPHFAVDVDYLNWWLREGRIPAALTTSSQASQGIIGRPDTQVLYGDQRLRTRHGDQFGGVRVNLNWWFNDEQTLGLEASAFFLERDSTHYLVTSDGSALLARPFVNADGTAASDVIAGQSPTGLRSGAFVGYSRIELFGEEANLTRSLWRGDGFALDFLAGARFLQMRDRADLTATGRDLPAQTTLHGLEDHIQTFNDYYGGQLGLRGELTCGRWSLLARGTIGLGADDETVRAYGITLDQTPTSRVVIPTGLSVQSTNTGKSQRTSLNMVASLGLNVNYQITRWAMASAGYSFLLWDGPVRSGDQIDPVIAAGSRPAIPFKQDVFWAHGLNVGLTFAW